MRRRRRRPGRATISTSKQSKIDRQMRAERVESPDAGGAVENRQMRRRSIALWPHGRRTPPTASRDTTFRLTRSPHAGRLIPYFCGHFAAISALLDFGVIDYTF